MLSLMAFTFDFFFFLMVTRWLLGLQTMYHLQAGRRMWEEQKISQNTSSPEDSCFLHLVQNRPTWSLLAARESGNTGNKIFVIHHPGLDIVLSYTKPGFY